MVDKRVKGKKTKLSKKNYNTFRLSSFAREKIVSLLFFFCCSFFSEKRVTVSFPSDYRATIREAKAEAERFLQSDWLDKR